LFFLISFCFHIANVEKICLPRVSITIRLTMEKEFHRRNFLLRTAMSHLGPHRRDFFFSGKEVDLEVPLCVLLHGGGNYRENTVYSNFRGVQHVFFLLPKGSFPL
jgi:hypothetical protein